MLLLIEAVGSNGRRFCHLLLLLLLLLLLDLIGELCLLCCRRRRRRPSPLWRTRTTTTTYSSSTFVLLHVFGQVRLLRVRLAAIVANVCLEVFGFFVLGYVLEQGRLVLEALVARVTFVRLVRLMGSRMRLQVAQLTEGLGAVWVTAAVRFVSRVRPHVLL